MFSEKPTLLEKFKRFRDMDLEAVKQTEHLSVHGVRFVSAIDDIINNLEDKAMTFAQLKLVGTSHKPRKVLPEEFEVGGLSLLPISPLSTLPSVCHQCPRQIRHQ